MFDRRLVLLFLASIAVPMALAIACQSTSSLQENLPEIGTESLSSAGASSRPVGLLIVDSTASQDSDPTFEKVVAFYGLSVKKVDLSQRPITGSELDDGSGAPFRAIAVNHKTLEKLAQAGNDLIPALRAAVTSGANLLVSGIAPVPEATDSLSLLGLTENKVSGARKPVDSQRNWRVEATFPDVTQELTGQSFNQTSLSQEDFALLVQAGATDVVPLVTSTDDSGASYPVFAKYSLGRGALFLDSNNSGNLDRSRMTDLYNSRHFGRLLPTMMFVRYAFGDMAWHSNARYANLSLDDPSLKEPWYSFSYRQTLLRTTSQGFHVTISMPPVSHLEAQKEVADLFLRNPDRLSVTMHGNNHDGYEFYKYAADPGDPHPARSINHQEADLVEALTRMEEFGKTTGLPFGRVMVFPHNISPLATIMLLKKYNYLATANAGNVPLGEIAREAFDFNMYPAVMDYGTFPLLTRYDPDQLPYALLFFLGKPVLPLAHVDFFRDKPDAFNSMAQSINNSWGKTPVAWKSLDEIVKGLYLEKVAEDGTRDVKFFSSQVVVTNGSDQSRTYNLEKAEGLEVPIARVEVNGRPAFYAVNKGVLRLSVDIQPGSSAAIIIIYGDASLPDLAVQSSGISYDKAKGLLSIQVENLGASPAPVPVVLYDGKDTRPVNILTLEPLAPGQKATAEVDLNKLPVKGDLSVRINPFQVLEESSTDNNEARFAAPEAAEVVAGDFEFSDVPSKHGWSIQKGADIGSLRVVYDGDAGSRVLELASSLPEPQDFKVNYPPPGQTLDVPKQFFRAKYKSTKDFEIFVRVTGADGNAYYVQYVPRSGNPSVYQNYLIYPLGVTSKDGAWHVLERDLNADTYGLFQAVDYIVVTGSVRLDDVTFGS